MYVITTSVELHHRPIWSCRYPAGEDVGRGSSTMVLQRLGIENSHCKAVEKFSVWCLLEGFFINGNGVDVPRKEEVAFGVGAYASYFFCRIL